MSKSYHVTYKDLEGKTREELEEMFDDPDLVLAELAEKSHHKKEIKNKRKADKAQK